MGAIGAALLVRALRDWRSGPCSTPHIPTAPALGFEVALTTLLVTVILGTADRHLIVGPNAALAVGATIALCGLIALPLKGASMNAPRSLGPALVTGRLSEVWIYIGGPFAGAALALVVNTVLHGSNAHDPRPGKRPRAKPEMERAAARLEQLPTWVEGHLNVVIETPKNQPNKLTYDIAAGAMRLGKVLPIGMVFPFDFGFLPSTRGADGDPLDVLVLMDAPTPPGCLVDARLVGVLRCVQHQETWGYRRPERSLPRGRPGSIDLPSGSKHQGHSEDGPEPDRRFLHPVQRACRP